MRVRRLTLEIMQQEEYLIGLRGLCSSMERAIKSGSRTYKGRQVEQLVLKIVAAEEKLQWQNERLAEEEKWLRARITAAVSELTTRRMLILRYVERQTWTQISKTMGLSRQWLYQLHKKTLALHVKC